MFLTASVECGKYFKFDRGTLTLADRQLRLEIDGRCQFDVSLSSIQKIVWHWYSFSGALEVTIAGQSYFLSFVPRSSALSAWYNGLSTGRRWRAALEGRPAPERATGPRLFQRIAQIVVLGCLALLSMAVAVDPAVSALIRILSSTFAVGAGLGVIVLLGRGAIAIGAALRGKK
jgi:hypothetical protein